MALAFTAPTIRSSTPSILSTRAVTSVKRVSLQCPRRFEVRAAVDDINSPDYNVYKAVKMDARRPSVGFTMYAEVINGRAAMIGFICALAIELITGEGVVDKILALTGKP